MRAPTLADPALQEQGVSLAAMLKQLAAIDPGRYDIVSCYVRLEPDDRRAGRCSTEVKTLIGAIDSPG